MAPKARCDLAHRFQGRELHRGCPVLVSIAEAFDLIHLFMKGIISMRIKTCLFASALLLTAAIDVRADIFSKAAREAAEAALKKFGGKASSEATEFLTKKIATAASRHGDDLIAAVRKVGPRAINLADDAGKNAPRALKFVSRYGDDGLRVLEGRQGMALFARFGDDAGRAIIKHPGVAEPLVDRMGVPAIKALEAIGPQNGRRLAMMGGDATPEMLGVIGKYGDPAMDFIWRNKGTLAGSAALAGFLANPEPYLNGGNTLVGKVADATVKPTFVAAGNVVSETATFIRWVLTIVAASLAVMTCWLLMNFRKPWASGVLRLLRQQFAR
jgi:hypothetical protein